MLRGKDGALWLGLDRDGILRFDGKAWTHFGAEQGVPEKSIGRLLEDRSGVLWAAAGEAGSCASSLRRAAGRASSCRGRTRRYS